MTDEKVDGEIKDVEILDTVDDTIAHMADDTDTSMAFSEMTPEQFRAANETLQSALQTSEVLAESTRDIVQSVCTLITVEKRIEATVQKYRLDVEHASNKLDKTMPAIEKTLDRLHDALDRDMDRLMAIDPTVGDEGMRFRRQQLMKLMMKRLDTIQELLLRVLSI